MLISCPKCHSIYDIPDDLIERTGQNFRCQACSNVWHAMPSDALGYEENKIEEKPFIEEIEVKEPPHRNYPANKEDYNIVNDTKSGRKVISSKKLVEQEGDPDYVVPRVKKKKEIVLTSDYGTSFTISMDNREVEKDEKNVPYLREDGHGELRADENKRITVKEPRYWFVKTRILLFVMTLLVLLYGLRGGMVMVYPQAEVYYNKIGLSGLSNEHNLEFNNLKISKETADDKEFIRIVADIHNNGILATNVPDVMIEGKSNRFKAQRSFLKAKEKTAIVIDIPVSLGEELLSFKLKFVK
jgi:predicted Zn finger-like uncharacterized protein